MYIQDKEVPEKPIRETLIFQQACSKSGNFLFINPIIGQTFKKNPFYLNTRIFPIDFIYPISEKYYTSITIPAGYEVETLPEPISLVLPDQKGKLFYHTSRDGNTIQLKYTFDINTQGFQNSNYPELKTMFDHYILKTKDQIVLRKI